MVAALCLIFMILVSLENVKKYSHVVAQLPQRLKSTLFEIFSTLRKNETKIVKVTHSGWVVGEEGELMVVVLDAYSTATYLK